MKVTTIIIATVLTLQVNFLFAGSKSISAPVANENMTLTLVSLTPATPGEATFEDLIMTDVYNLMPVTPEEANYEDLSFEMVSSLVLAPVTPVVAGFEDENDLSVNICSLAPVTPDEADFE
ncbi:MAG: hypothetical protein NTU51_01545 [Bacteroidetes bacterium]|nr:hypothetical protein [Bacteroidota bacterium]